MHAQRIYARSIICKELKARDGRIGRQSSGKGKGHDKGGNAWGNNEVRVPELRVDVLYAKEIKADYVEADEVQCKEIRVGR